MKMMLSVLSSLLFTATSLAQITIPDEVSPFEPIIAGCNCQTPKGSEVKIKWQLSSTDAHMVAVGNSVHIWARPGQHKLVASVVWMQFEAIEVPTSDGGKRKIKSLVGWDLQSYSKQFTVKGDAKPVPPDDEDEDEDDPNPPTPSNSFEKIITDGLRKIGNPLSRKKVAKVYSEVAEKANTRRDVYKPAIMVDEAKTNVASSLTPSELSDWVDFWPVLGTAMRARKMEESDTDAHIVAFRELAEILNR